MQTARVRKLMWVPGPARPPSLRAPLHVHNVHDMPHLPGVDGGSVVVGKVVGNRGFAFGRKEAGHGAASRVTLGMPAALRCCAPPHPTEGHAHVKAEYC
jgi:hypothetical protein